MVETPQIQYVNKVLHPQRVMKPIEGKREIKHTINIDLSKRHTMGGTGILSS